MIIRNPETGQHFTQAAAAPLGQPLRRLLLPRTDTPAINTYAHDENGRTNNMTYILVLFLVVGQNNLLH
jgi:hypothetical protein